jgi:gamma-tubulin complex component 2
MLNKFLPVCSDFKNIENFIETYSSYNYGRVYQALSAAMRDVLNDYFMVVTQIEYQAKTNNNFSLQKILFHLNPSMELLACLKSLIVVLESPEHAETIGGGILSVISNQITIQGG